MLSVELVIDNYLLESIFKLRLYISESCLKCFDCAYFQRTNYEVWNL